MLSIDTIYNINHQTEIIIEAYITDNCNLHCNYCINLIRGYRRQNINLNIIQLYKFISFLQKITNKNILLIFLGGEPTLHPDLLDFCEKIKNNQHIKLLLYTNFQHTINFYYNFTVYNNVKIKISFHYIDDTKLNIFLDKLNKLIYKKNIINEIIVMLTNDFEKCIDAFFKIKNVFKNTTCSILEKNDIYQPNYTNEQLRIYNNIIIQNDKNSNIIVKHKNTIKDNISFFSIINNVNFYKWLCYAGKEQLFIDLYGNISPCKNNNTILSTIFNYTNLKMHNIICLYNKKCTNEITYRKKIFKCQTIV